MSNFNQQDADMMPRPHGGYNRGGYRGRGRGFQSFDSPFGSPSQRGRGFHSGGGRGQKNYINGPRGNWKPRGQGRGRGEGHRGRDRGFYQAVQEQSRPARHYVLPAMTSNPWEELEAQFEAEKLAKQS